MQSEKFIPYPFYWDDVPVDLSFIYENEKPAGKHGFLEVQGDKFVFEDGKEAKFWGTNFNSRCNFPSAEFSEKVAKRLAKIGINMVRLHQLDAEWSTPNIFQFTKGKCKGNTLDLDPESMKRLDYLIYCLKQEGIYLYLDMLTYRKFKSGDGVENTIGLIDAARPHNHFNARLIELQKKFCYDVWTHVNPYTGLAYKDEPAIVLTEIANEASLFCKYHAITAEPYKTELNEKYKKWLEAKGIDSTGKELDFSGRDALALDFQVAIQEEYYKEMAAYMRGIGVKVPVTGTNWSVNAANRKAQLVTDFADGHSYWYDWEWGEKIKKFKNKSMVTDSYSFYPDLSFSRLPDRPYIVSEWDEPWPNEWRAESSLFLAAVGALQAWSGILIHTYAYSDRTDIDFVGKEISSASIGNVPYREGVFTCWNDPAKFGLFYHAALMFRRGDIMPAKESVAIKIDNMALTPETTPALSLITEKHRVGMKFEGQTITADREIQWNEEIVDKSTGEVLSDTGEVYRSWKDRLGWIDTEGTKVVYGFLGDAGEIAIKGMKINSKTEFATIAVSSLTDEPIKKTDNILLTTIGRSENTGMKFNEDHTEMLEAGSPPILVETIEAEIKIETERPNMRVLSINAEGFLMGVVPSEYKDGVLGFRTGVTCPSMYYLIQAE